MTQANPAVFVITRQFAASPERVYEAWADPAKMTQWSGPKGSSVEIIRGSQAVGQTTIARTTSPSGPEMFSLCRWRELTPHSRVVWEQSFCTPEGVKCAPPFFDDWPQTLLTEVSLEPRGDGTFLTLKWTPIEYTEAALAMFIQQMGSMTGGWGGSSTSSTSGWLVEARSPVGMRSATVYPTTPDGRYFVVRGRLWRKADPALPAERRAELVKQLMDARRALRGQRNDSERALARVQVDEAKRGLGERGPVWWTDGAPDFNRKLVRNSPYADWHASQLAAAEGP